MSIRLVVFGTFGRERQKDWFTLGPLKLLKKPTQTFIAFLLPFVLNMHTGYFSSCGPETSICCVESRL